MFLSILSPDNTILIRLKLNYIYQTVNYFKNIIGIVNKDRINTN